MFEKTNNWEFKATQKYILGLLVIASFMIVQGCTTYDYEYRNIKLESIGYFGDNIGNDWDMTFTINGVSKTLRNLPIEYGRTNVIDRLLFAGPIIINDKEIYIQGKEKDMIFDDEFNTKMSLEGGDTGVEDYNYISGSFFFVEVSLPDKECELKFKFSYEVKRK